MYKINEVSELSGVTTRTLRYYDEIELLKPAYINESGYRIYTDTQLDILQQILLYRELDLPLSKIKQLLSEATNPIKTLQIQKNKLKEKQNRLNNIINTIDVTIQSMKGEITMSSNDKFEALKEQVITENERAYGSEIREKYGTDTIDASYTKMRKMSTWEFNEAKRIGEEINTKLHIAINTGDATSIESMEVCKLHEQWIKMYWSTYSKEAHLGLVEMYTKDDRFRSYYDKVKEGAALFLLDAMKHYLN